MPRPKQPSFAPSPLEMALLILALSVTFWRFLARYIERRVNHKFSVWEHFQRLYIEKTIQKQLNPHSQESE